MEGGIELTDPEAQKAIEELRVELKKWRIFPYLPREKKGGEHENSIHQESDEGIGTN